MRRTRAGTRPLAERLQHRVAEAGAPQEGSGERRCCWFTAQLRQNLTRFTCGRACRTLHVLAWNEIPDNRKVRLVTAVGSKFDDKRGV